MSEVPALNSLHSVAGKVVLVTGAAGILGRRFSEAFAANGASVALIDVDAARVDELARELSTRYGVRTAGIACDVTSPESVDSMVTQTVAALGQIDVLLNNAATKGRDVRAFFTPFEEYPLDVWREVMSVNIDGMFLVAQRVGRQMIAQGQGGAVIQTSSIYGLVAPDPRIYEGSEYLGGPINTPAVYAASKAAVVGLTRYLAAYWGPQRIRVNCVAPGGVSSGQNGIFSENYSKRVPLQRMAQADEIASAVLYLAAEGSSYMTAQVLAVDGGWTCW
jgi:NAD(P)-dependent dehydrogenase (short-subunit alcohol dehydrogenase family)